MFDHLENKIDNSLTELKFQDKTEAEKERFIVPSWLNTKQSLYRHKIATLLTKQKPKGL